jgi:hypothetical protein
MKGFATKSPEVQDTIMAISDAVCAIKDRRAVDFIRRFAQSYVIVEKQEARKARVRARRARQRKGRGGRG